MSKRNDRRDPQKETFWKRTVREQAGSGLSVRAFCRRKRLSEPSFYAWRRELKRRQEEGKAADARQTSSKPTFLPVALGEVTTAVELILPSGVVLRLPQGTEFSAVADLVANLERRPC